LETIPIYLRLYILESIHPLSFLLGGGGFSLGCHLGDKNMKKHTRNGVKICKKDEIEKINGN
jgi:hypothetical protein